MSAALKLLMSKLLETFPNDDSRLWFTMLLYDENSNSQVKYQREISPNFSQRVVCTFWVVRRREILIIDKNTWCASLKKFIRLERNLSWESSLRETYFTMASKTIKKFAGEVSSAANMIWAWKFIAKRTCYLSKEEENRGKSSVKWFVCLIYCNRNKHCRLVLFVCLFACLLIVEYRLETRLDISI